MENIFLLAFIISFIPGWYYSYKAYQYIKPEYKTWFSRYFRRQHFSREKYINEAGIKYRNKMTFSMFTTIFLFFTYVIYSSSQPLKISSKIHNSYSQDTTIINIKKLTDFEWDRFYIFNEGIDEERMSAILKYDAGADEEDIKFVFMKDGKEVHFEEIETQRTDHLRIKIKSGMNYMSFPPDSATFILTEAVAGYYILESVYK